MEFQKAIETRRSIRKYDPEKQVTKEQLEEMVQAAIQAPSWKNSQTSRYYCITSGEKMEKFREECLPEFNAKNCKDAAALIVTAYKKNHSGFAADGVTPANELGNGWGIYDLGLHDAYLLLKATELGLATLVMGIRDAKKIRKMLEIPEEEEIVSVISVGYPAVEPTKPARKSVEDIAKFF